MAWTIRTFWQVRWAICGQTEQRGRLTLPAFPNSLQSFLSLSTHFAEWLKDAPKHVLCDVEVQGAHIEAHWPAAALLQVVSHGCQSVFLSLGEKELKARIPNLLPPNPFSPVSFTARSPVKPGQ